MKNVFGGRPKYCINSTTSGGSADRLWYYSDDDCSAGSWIAYDAPEQQQLN